MLLLLLLMLCGAVWAKPVAALCYVAGLALTLVLAAHVTPAGWWRRPTVRGLFIVAGGTWACGSALALAAGLGAPTLSHQPVTPTMADAAAQSAPANAAVNRPFRVHRSLNLRADADVGSVRLAVIPAGALLTPTGARHGDWWQVRSHSGDRELTGWVSSLWLRRMAEHDNQR